MKLEFPNETHKNSYEEMIKKWGECENLEDMSPGALFKGNNYEEFLEYTKKAVTNSETGVNANLYFLTEKENIFGALQIRHTLGNPILEEIGGHIGYGIAPEYRGKGYANEMLRLGLIEATKLGINKILISCTIDNKASEKVILNNGGVFERKSFKEEFKEHGEFNRYWINL